MSGPCNWTVDRCGCGTTCWEGYTPAQRADAAALAVAHMWAATGRRYGLCELTVIVCTPSAAEPLYQTFPVAGPDRGGGVGLAPYIDTTGEWRNRACGVGCACAAACEVGLDGPVDSVVEVTVAGQVVDPDAYEVHDRRLLVRTDGVCWPSCGSMTPTYGMTATYLRGLAIPAAVQAATERLACEYAKACTGGDCALPDRLANLSRQGVSITVAETGGEGGDWWRTDLDQVDRVIAADNPGHRRGRSLILSPDLPAHRVVTWAGGS